MVNNKSLAKEISIINKFTQIYHCETLKEYGINGSGQLGIVFQLFTNPEGLCQEDIARNLILDKASVSRMVKPLLKNSIIDREINPNDKRAYILKLNSKMLPLIPEIREKVLNWTDILCKGMSPEDREKLSELLEVLNKNGSHYIKGKING